jgi:hypothetical protein
MRSAFFGRRLIQKVESETFLKTNPLALIGANITFEASSSHMVSPSPTPPVKRGESKTLSPGGRGQGEGELEYDE